MSVLKNFTNFSGNTCVGVSFNKVASLQACNFIEKSFQHGCFPVKFTKFLRKPFFIEHFRWTSQKQMRTRCHKEYTLYGHNLRNTIVVSFDIYMK